MTGPKEEDMYDLEGVISHLENKTDNFKRLYKILEDLRDSPAEVSLDASPDRNFAEVWVTERKEPSSEMLALLEFQDSNNHIEYLPEGNRYRLEVKLWL